MIFTAIRASLINQRATKNAFKVIDRLEIKSGNTVADIGSGGGYFTFLFAGKTAPDGKVYAVDTDAKFMRYIERKAKKHGVANIETVAGKADDCPLPDESCDLIFMRNVFHHIENPNLYLRSAKKCLKKEGIIAVIEWVPNGKGFERNRRLPENRIRLIFQEAGYCFLDSFDFLKGQSFNIFQKAQRP